MEFICSNCESKINLENASIGMNIECPTCFNINSIKSISPPEFEFLGDASSFDDSKDVPKFTSVNELNLASEKGKYLCIPFTGYSKGVFQSPSENLSNQLEEILNKYNELGWEFVRIDTVRVNVNLGCLFSTIAKTFFGIGSHQREYDIVIFTRP